LQYRIEGMIAFSEDFVGRLQAVSTAGSNIDRWRGGKSTFRIKNGAMLS
jgi:hypothetical protein